jgi:hypothetical protein
VRAKDMGMTKEKRFIDPQNMNVLAVFEKTNKNPGLTSFPHLL